MTPTTRRSIVALLATCGLLVACTGNDRDHARATAPTTRPASMPAGGSATVGDTTIDVSARAERIAAVAPAPGGVAEGVDRDAGISVRLRTGAVLWLFGDTAAHDASGALSYFVIGTGALAAADAPSVTLDAVGPDGAPAVLAEPGPDFGRCADGDRAGMWPAAAVVDGRGPVDRVVVWLENICLRPGGGVEDRGMSVAEWTDDPALPLARPIRLRVLRQVLFPSRSYGSAAVLGDDGRVTVYRCDNRGAAEVPPRLGPCHAASVGIDEVADPGAYREWDGATFAAPVGEGVAMQMAPGTADSSPPGGLTVVRDPVVGAYVMADSPWPGRSSRMVLRFAREPQGPWTRPVAVDLPGCADRIGERRFACYAATAQPEFSSPGRLGIGWYDERANTGVTVRGAYTVGSVAVDVSP